MPTTRGSFLSEGTMIVDSQLNKNNNNENNNNGLYFTFGGLLQSNSTQPKSLQYNLLLMIKTNLVQKSMNMSNDMEKFIPLLFFIFPGGSAENIFSQK